MTANDLLILARGPLFDIALFVFIAGMLLRLIEVVSLGRKGDLSEGRGSSVIGGLKLIAKRSIHGKEFFAASPLRLGNGYVMHIALFIVILLYEPHIALAKSTLGVSWPGLPSGVIDAFAVITMLSMLIALFYRLAHPVVRFISVAGDYVVWVVTFLPVLTGYLAYNHLLLPYTWMLALHILSVELLLVVAPFSKLTHMFSFAAARWFQGANAGHRGVAS